MARAVRTSTKRPPPSDLRMLNLALKTALSLASPAGARGRLSVLIFHRVLPGPDALFPDEIDTAQFDRICSWLKALFTVLPLDDAVHRLGAGSLPARAACITFDDGYADNRQQALPILQRHQLPATFYIATGFLNGGRMWNDTVIESIRRTPSLTLDLRALQVDGLASIALGSVAQRRSAIGGVIRAIKHLRPDIRLQATQRLAELAAVALPTDLMMSTEQVRELQTAGMLIGAHTVTHPILATLTADEAREEIVRSRHALEDMLGQRVGHFAYPNGQPGHDYSDETVRVVRELGFDSAVSTHWGASRASSDRLQLPRFTPWDRTPTRFALRLLRNLWLR